LQCLAAAREASVLAVWSGLGYYHRARRMREAAKVIVRERKGEFPRTAEEWRKLPGIGRYTAAAIASIAFGEPAAVVDGNVERVLERMCGKTGSREAVWQQAEALLDRERPGDFNQAMMELGATLCTPRSPQCLLCPVNTWCQFPGTKARSSQPARKRKQVWYALVRNDGAVLLVQRPADASLMAGMWELPTILESRRNASVPLARIRHSITDTDYEVSVLPATPALVRILEGNARWFTRKQWQKLALTGLTRKVLRKLAVESAGLGTESNKSTK